MDKILDAIKCVNCNSVLSTPVLLPCGHSICRKHVSSGSKSVHCGKCLNEQSVPSSGHFPINEQLVAIIDARIESLNLGSTHKEAKKGCKSLSEAISHIDHILTAPEHVAADAIGEMKRRIDLKREKLKLQIDQEANKMLVSLESYRQKCDYDTISKQKRYKKEVERVTEAKQAAETELGSWQNLLNMIDQNDEKRWAEIKEKSDLEVLRLKERTKELEAELLLNENEMQMAQVDFFENVNIDALFDFRMFQPKEQIVCVGGWFNGSPTNLIEIYDPKSDSWQSIDSTSFVPRFGHGCVSMDKYIYVIGGGYG